MLRDACRLPDPEDVGIAVVYGPGNLLFFARLGALCRGMRDYRNRAAAAEV